MKFVSQSSSGGGPSLQVHVVRFAPGQELLGSLQAFVEERKLQAPFIITCVGSVTKATLRMANATATNTNEVPDCGPKARERDFISLTFVCSPSGEAPQRSI